MTVRCWVGSDGWKGGWVAIVLSEQGLLEAGLCTRAGEVLERWPDAEAFAFDIPIGLVDDPIREADVAARAVLGPRASSVFPAPSRVCLGASSWEEANRLSHATVGKGLTKQAWALVEKIQDVDAIKGDHRVVEVHPEVSFALLAGAPLPAYKKTWAGQMHRRRLLAVAGIHLPDDLGPAGVVPVDDVLDAVAAAWTARRVALGTARRFPELPGQVDESGRPIAILA